MGSKGRAGDRGIHRDSARWIVAARVALLLLVAGGATLGWWLAVRHDRVATHAGGEFLCPMHLDVTSAAPGECPICGMALVKVRALSLRDAAHKHEDGAADETIAAAQILSQAAGGVAANLVGYYPSPLRQHVLRYELFAPAWLETETDLAVLVYRDQLPTLDAAEVALFSPTSKPATEGTPAEVHLVAGAPTGWDQSLSLVHFALATAAPALPRGTVGWVKFPPRPRAMQVIPAGAVLQAPEGPYVLVVAGAQGTASKRPIEVGRIVTGLAAVLSGLDLREQVVSVNAFFWDAERRLQADRRAGSGGVLR